MSEEKMQNEAPAEKKCKFTMLITLVVISLLLSIASLVLSTLAYNNSNGSTEGKKVVISKQYDRGRTLQKALETKKPVVVFFYTDWCGFCQRFAPVFDKITKDSKIKKNFAVAYVNCEKEENHKLMEEYGVHGFPTVFVIDEDNKKTQLDNNTFFNEDTKTVVKEKMLELIDED